MRCGAARAARREDRMRSRTVRQLHGARRRRAGARLRDAGQQRRAQDHHHHRRTGARRQKPDPIQAAFIAEQAAQCGYCTSGMIMAPGPCCADPDTDARAGEGRARGQSVSLRDLHAHPPRGHARRAGSRRVTPRDKVKGLENLFSTRLAARRQRRASSSASRSIARDAGRSARAARGPRRDARTPRSIRRRSTASSRSIRTAASRSTRVRSTSAPACASRSRRWRPKSWASPLRAFRSSTAIPARCPNHGGTGGSTGLTRGGTAVRQAAATARQALLASPPTHLNPGRRPHDRRRRGAAADPRAARHRRGRFRSAACSSAAVSRSPSTPRRRSPPRPATPSSAHRRTPRRSREVHRTATPTSRITSSRACSTRRVLRPPALGARLSPWTRLDRPSARRSHRPPGKLPGRGREKRVGRGARGPRAEGHVDRVAGTARPRQPRTLSARRRRRAGADVRRPRQRRHGDGWRRTEAVGHVLLALPEPRLARAVLCGRRRPRRAARRSGPRRRSPMACARRWRACSASTRRRCGSSSSKGRDRTAPTAPIMPRPTPCCCRRLSARRSACSGRGRTSTDGIRKDRSSCSISAPGSMPTGGSWRGRPRCGFPANRRGARILLAAEAAGLPQDSGRDCGRHLRERRPVLSGRARARAGALDARHAAQSVEPARAGQAGNVFAVEGFIDEIAAATGIDPLAFRLQRLTDPRALDVLTRGAAAFKWDAAAVAEPAAATAPVSSAAAWPTRATSRPRTTSRCSWRSRSTPRPARSP